MSGVGVEAGMRRLHSREGAVKRDVHSVRGTAAEVAPRLLPLHCEAGVPFLRSRAVVRPEGRRPGVSAGGWVAHLGLFVGVVSGVPGLVAPLAGLRALRVPQWAVEDLQGGGLEG